MKKKMEDARQEGRRMKRGTTIAPLARLGRSPSAQTMDEEWTEGSIME